MHPPDKLHSIDFASSSKPFQARPNQWRSYQHWCCQSSASWMPFEVWDVGKQNPEGIRTQIHESWLANETVTAITLTNSRVLCFEQWWLKNDESKALTQWKKNYNPPKVHCPIQYKEHLAPHRAPAAWSEDYLLHLRVQNMKQAEGPLHSHRPHPVLTGWVNKTLYLM